MTFGEALEFLKAGSKVARMGWNGKGMFLVYVPGAPNCRWVEAPYYKAWKSIDRPDPEITIDPHIDMLTAKGTMQPGWLASQADMLADDWVVVL